MGDWYVIANIPSRFERGAHNAVENYRLTADGTIPTTFSYRKDGFEGKLKTVRSKAFVQDPVSNAVWGVQFIWPIKAEYLIAHLDDAYTRTVIARNKRDDVWIMARTSRCRRGRLPAPGRCRPKPRLRHHEAAACAAKVVTAQGRQPPANPGGRPGSAAGTETS